MRYFTELAYNGTRYHGWQKQQHSISVQEVLENAFSTILNTKIEVTGCGRTDTGVHARQYFLHFDFDDVFPEGFISRINKFLPADIAVRRVYEVADSMHARFDAILRSYEYHIVFEKTPFEPHTSWHYYLAASLDQQLMNKAAGLLLNYKEFAPFCKTNHDAKTMTCELSRAEWLLDESGRRLVFHISANRFLRGMVRLIVGMCIQVALGKISLEDIEYAMDNQVMLTKSWSVPPHGLFLTEIRYK